MEQQSTLKQDFRCSFFRACQLSEIHKKITLLKDFRILQALPIPK